MDKRLKLAIMAAEKGAEAALSVAQNQVTQVKEGVVNVATKADLASNRIIIEKITQAFPHDLIISEETDYNPDDLYQAKRLWVIDPLDGTNNFRFGRKYSAVSIGFVMRGEPTIGVVYDIFNHDLYTASKGGERF